MTTHNVSIKVGVVLDRDVMGAFQPIAKAAKEARQKTAAELDKVAKDTKERIPKAAREAAKELDKIAEQEREVLRRSWAARDAVVKRSLAAKTSAEKKAAADAKAIADQEYQAQVRIWAARSAMVRKGAAEKVAAEKAAARATASAQADGWAADRALTRRGWREKNAELRRARQEQERDERAATSDRMRRASESERATMRASARRSREARRAIGRGVSTGLQIAGGALGLSSLSPVHLATQVAGMPFALGKSLLAGAGANFDLGSAAGKGIDLERAASSLSNQAYMPGQKGANGRRQDPKKLLAESYAISNELGEDPAVALEGMGRFVKKTGDLSTVRPILRDLGQLSKAFGTDLSDMADSAADVSLQLGDIPDKGRLIVEVLKNVAAQGKMGAVEVSDLAVQMAKVAEASRFFENAKGGGVGGNVKTFTALAQLSKAHGGAATPVQAATSVQSFVNTFDKPARIAGFANLGIDVHGKTKGIFKDPVELIAALLRKTKGDTERMSGAVADARAKSVTKGAAALFREGYADEKTRNPAAKEGELVEAGVRRFREEMERLTAATVSQSELVESLAAVQNDAKSDVQRFNNQMQLVATELAKEFLPVLTGLTPIIARLGAAAVEVIDAVTGAKDRTNLNEEIKTGTDLVGLEGSTRRVLQSGRPGKPAEMSQGTYDDLMGRLGEFRTKLDAEQKNIESSAQPNAIDKLIDVGRGVRIADQRFTSRLLGMSSDEVNAGTDYITRNDETPGESKRRIAAIRSENLAGDRAREQALLAAILDAVKHGTLKVTSTDPVSRPGPRVLSSGRSGVDDVE